MLVDMLRSQGVVPLALVAPAAGASRAVLADFGPEEVEPFLRKLGLLPARP